MAHRKKANEAVKWEKKKGGEASGWKSRKEDRTTEGGGKDGTGELSGSTDSSCLPERPRAAQRAEPVGADTSLGGPG